MDVQPPQPAVSKPQVRQGLLEAVSTAADRLPEPAAGRLRQRAGSAAAELAAAIGFAWLAGRGVTDWLSLPPVPAPALAGASNWSAALSRWTLGVAAGPTGLYSVEGGQGLRVLHRAVN